MNSRVSFAELEEPTNISEFLCALIVIDKCTFYPDVIYRCFGLRDNPHERNSLCGNSALELFELTCVAYLPARPAWRNFRPVVSVK